MSNSPVGQTSTSERLDTELLDEMRELLGMETFAERLDAFLLEIRGLAAALARFENDPSSLAGLAHERAGAASIFGAQEFRHALARVEAAARGRRLESLPELVSQALAAGVSAERELKLWSERPSPLGAG